MLSPPPPPPASTRRYGHVTITMQRNSAEMTSTASSWSASRTRKSTTPFMHSFRRFSTCDGEGTNVMRLITCAGAGGGGEGGLHA